MYSSSWDRNSVKISTRTGKLKKVHNQKGEPEEKSVNFRKVCLVLKVPMGFSVKFYCFTCLPLPTHLPIPPQYLSHEHQTQKDGLHSPRERWHYWQMFTCSVSFGGCQSSCPKLGKQQLVSVASICYRLPENQASAAAVSIGSEKKYTTSRSHAETQQGFTQPRRLEMLCLNCFLLSQVCTGMPRT